MTREELLQISKPILFNDVMVRAILDERKTETRRIAKGVPKNAYRVEPVDVFDDGTIPLWDFLYGVPLAGGGRAEMFETIRAPYKRGDIIYLRETWGIGNIFYDDNDEPNLCVCYKASKDMEKENCITFKINEEEYEKFSDIAAERPQWIPSIHMPKKAARIFLRVKDVIPEKLQEISNAQVIAEGIGKDVVAHYAEQMPTYEDEYVRLAHLIPYIDLWDSTIKPKDRDKYGWAANPWVFVISFERIFPKEEEDA